jgi:hypothetical protein
VVNLRSLFFVFVLFLQGDVKPGKEETYENEYGSAQE